MTGDAKSAAPAPGLSAEQKRQLVLGGVAALLVIVFAVVYWQKQAANAVVATAAVDRGTTHPEVANLPPPGDPNSEKWYQTHYKPILDAELFVERTFHKRPTPRYDKDGHRIAEGDTTASVTSRDSSSGSHSDMVTLRITAIVAQGQTSYALLESPGTGKGCFLKAGDKVGTQVVAEITTDTLTLLAAEIAGLNTTSTAANVAVVDSRTRASEIAATGSNSSIGIAATSSSATIGPMTMPHSDTTAGSGGNTAAAGTGTGGGTAPGHSPTPAAPTPYSQRPGAINVRIGLTLDLKPQDITLETLGSATVGASGTIIPKLSEERKLSVLEQLRLKRKASLGETPPADASKPK